MTSDIQWDEDWFSVSDARNPLEETEREAIGGEAIGGEAIEESIESIKEWIEKDVRKQEKEKEDSVGHIHQRIDWLEQLIHRQNEIIRGLGEEVSALMATTGILKTEIEGLKTTVKDLQGELHSTSRTSMTHLLDELKRVKERELNYALRRHQPIPFFDSGNLMRLVGSMGTTTIPSPMGTMGSPLFRPPSQKVQMPSLHL